jgi:hypothetical protein
MYIAIPALLYNGEKVFCALRSNNHRVDVVKVKKIAHSDSQLNEETAPESSFASAAAQTLKGIEKGLMIVD